MVSSASPPQGCSRMVLSCDRSFWLARRIARAIIGANSFEKPAGSPRLRSFILVPPAGEAGDECDPGADHERPRRFPLDRLDVLVPAGRVVRVRRIRGNHGPWLINFDLCLYVDSHGGGSCPRTSMCCWPHHPAAGKNGCGLLLAM